VPGFADRLSRATGQGLDSFFDTGQEADRVPVIVKSIHYRKPTDMSKLIITSAIGCLLLTTAPHPAIAAPSVLLPADQAQALLEQCSRPTPEDVDGSWTVPVATLKRLERDLPQLSQLGPKPAAIGGKAFDPGGFYRQYVGITVHGRKLIYINAFGGSGGHIPFDLPWRKTPVVVCDGGSSHWGAIYDPKTHKFSQLQFNGR
jgi:hypothetical protein